MTEPASNSFSTQPVPKDIDVTRENTSTSVLNNDVSPLKGTEKIKNKNISLPIPVFSEIPGLTSRQNLSSQTENAEIILSISSTNIQTEQVVSKEQIRDEDEIGRKFKTLEEYQCFLSMEKLRNRLSAIKYFKSIHQEEIEENQQITIPSNSPEILINPVNTSVSVTTIHPEEREVKIEDAYEFKFKSIEDIKEFKKMEKNKGTHITAEYFKSLYQEETEEKNKAEKLAKDIENHNKANLIVPPVAPIPQTYIEAIGKLITPLNPATLNFNAKSGLLIFYPIRCPPENMNPTSDYIKFSLINTFGEGKIFVKFEPNDLILVFFKFDSKIHRTSINSFTVLNVLPYCVCSIQTDNIKSVAQYVSGIAEIGDLLFKKKVQIKGLPAILDSEEIKNAMANHYLDERTWQMLISVIRSGCSHLESSIFMATLLNSYLHYKPVTSLKEIKGKQKGYVYNKETRLYELKTSSGICRILGSVCKSVIDQEILRLYGENSACFSKEKETLMSDLGKYKKQANTLQYLKSCKELIDTYSFGKEGFIETLDKDPNCAAIKGGKYIDFRNGVVKDRDETMPFSFEYPVNYRPELKGNKLIDNFLENITLADTKYLDYMLMKLGYGITGWTKDQKAYFLLGLRGSNGKTTLMTLVDMCIGDHFKTGDTSIIFKKKGSIPKSSDAPTPSKTFIKDGRFVYIPEADDMEEIEVGTFKRLTGGEKDSYRGMGEEKVKYIIRYKIFISANQPPTISIVSISDGGLMRRTEIFPFNCEFREEKDITDRTYQRPMDDSFLEKVTADPEALDYFFTLLVKGAMRYWDKPKRSPKPDCVTQAIEDFKSDRDVMLYFINDCCTITGLEEDKTSCQTLFSAYCKWFQTNNAGSSPKEDKIQFGRMLTHKMGGDKCKCKISGGLAAYKGIKLKESEVVNTANLPAGSILTEKEAKGTRMH